MQKVLTHPDFLQLVVLQTPLLTTTLILLWACREREKNVLPSSLTLGVTCCFISPESEGFTQRGDRLTHVHYPLQTLTKNTN